MGSEWKGITMLNTEVAPFIRKHGAPVHSKPHGAQKTILYYANPDADEAAVEDLKDYAGEPTPAGRSRVIQKPNMGGTSIGSTVSTLERKVSTAIPQATPAGNNPNRLAERAEIVNADALDPDVQELEEQQVSKKSETEAGTLSTAEAVKRVEQDTEIKPPSGDELATDEDLKAKSKK